MMTRYVVNKIRRYLPMAVILLLTACAGNVSYQQGMEMLNQGRLIDSLPMLEQASREAPNNREFRIRYLNAREQVVGSLLAEAQREKALGRFDESEALYLRVLGIDRDNRQALSGVTEIKQGRRHAQLLNEATALIAASSLEVAEQKVSQVLQENARQPEALTLRRLIEDQKGQNQDVLLNLRKSFQKPVTLEFVDAGFKQVLEALSRHSGLNFVLDKDVPSGITITVFLRQVSVDDALDVILTSNQLRKRVLTDTTVLIYPDTLAKQSDNQDLVVKSYFLANADAKQVMAMLKTILKAKTVFTEEKLNLVIMRDTPAMIQLADRLVATQDVPEPEVMLDVEIIEIQRSRLLNLGIAFPNSLVLTPLPLVGSTLNDLRNINSTTTSAVLSPTTINLQRQVGNTNLLANPRIRTHNREKALIRIGDRLPVITNTATATGFVAENVQYIDVGLKFEVEPTIFTNDEISIKLALEVSSIIKEIVSKSGTTTYQIGTRNAATVLRLKDGETQVLGGLINDQDVQNANRFPGLGDLPIVGRLFSSQRDARDKTELLLSITPRLVRGMTASAYVPNKFWSGTENEPRMNPMGQSGNLPENALPKAQSPVAALTPAQPAASSSASAVPGVPLLNWLGPTSVKAGSTFRLTLNVTSPAAVARFPLQISYDKEIFEVLDVAPGGFMAQGDVLPDVAKQIDTQAGMVSFSQNRPAAGAMGSGSLLEIELRARKPVHNSHITVLSTHALNSDRQSLGPTRVSLIGLSVTP